MTRWSFLDRFAGLVQFNDADELTAVTAFRLPLVYCLVSSLIKPFSVFSVLGLNGDRVNFGSLLVKDEFRHG